MKIQLGLTKPELFPNATSVIKKEKNLPDTNATNENHFSDITSSSDSLAKIHLFMALFKGRDDVYAKRWENKGKGTSGYSPVCLNLWQPGVCGKPKISCSKCAHKSYAALDEGVIENHLRGNIVVGIYPMLPDDVCCFLAMDFDEGDWQNDISVVRDVCIDSISLLLSNGHDPEKAVIYGFFSKIEYQRL